MRYENTPRVIGLLIILVSARLSIGQATRPSAPSNQAIVGQLLNVDGKPLAGTKMCLCSRGLFIWSPALPYDDPARPDGSVFSTTDGSGHFSFPAESKDCNLLAYTDDGYLIAKSKRFTFPLTVRLTAWATLKGALKVGDRAGPAGTPIEAAYEDGTPDELGPWPRPDAVTGEHGLFKFDHLLAGTYKLSRPLGVSISVNAAAGVVTECVVPVVGQAVHGRIAMPKEITQQRWQADWEISQPTVLPELELPGNILQMTADEQVAWYNRWESQSPEGKRIVAQRKDNGALGVQLKDDGTFFANDLHVGRNVLHASVFPRTDSSIDYEHPLANVAYDLAVPSAEGDALLKPLELGTLSSRVDEITNAGQKAPDIAFRTSTGANVQLSSLRGKVVFLDFWGVWCANCQHDVPNLKAIYDAYGGNPHFAMISLDVFDDPNTWTSFTQAHQMTWTQGFLGTAGQAWQTKAFCVTGYPSYWLIGPDGKVLAEGHQSPLIRPFVEKALSALN